MRVEAERLKLYLTRDDFVNIINEMDLKVGVEIGVRDGGYSERILQTNIEKLYGIDIAVTPGANRLIREYPDVYVFKQARSPGCAADFDDEFFDFIHIDADHSFNAVCKDLGAWWPKLKVGGIFSGDDYITTDNPMEGKYGVVEAVNNFVDKMGLSLFVTGVGIQNRENQIKFADENAAQANLFFRGQSYKPFVTPCWYVRKG